MYLEPAVFKLRVLIGQRAGSNFHSIPRELIVSPTFVSRGNNSNCFHRKQFWPSLVLIFLADSRCITRVTTHFREPWGPSSALAALSTLQPGPPRLSKTRSYPCSTSNLYVRYECMYVFGGRMSVIFAKAYRNTPHLLTL